MNTELKEAIELLEKEKHISRESLLESIEMSLMHAGMQGQFRKE